MASKGVESPQAGKGQPLPKKESDLFKSVVKHYEMKQYKKGIKHADTILKKFPNHGETLAMKGLTLNCMNKREEAHALVRKGLMNDMRSHVCWHVFGLLHRSDRNYNEAIKAYKQALKIDSDNLQILRDLSLLQIQMRDLSGFAVTRHHILTLKPNAKMNWLSFAMAKCLTGDMRGSISVIDIYLGTLSPGAPELERGFESSELAMFRNTVLANIPNNYEEALKHLEECKGVVVDEDAWLKAKASYQLQLGMHTEAKQSVLAMFRRGMTEDHNIHSSYMCCVLKADPATCQEAASLTGTGTLATMKCLSLEQKAELVSSYRGEISSIMPRSPAARRIILTLLEGDEFRQALDAYCKKHISKGVPSLGSDLSSLYLIEKNGKYVRAEDPVEIREHSTYQMIVTMVDSYIDSLAARSTYPEEMTTEEPPSTLLWAWYLRARLFQQAGQFTEAIEVTDKCLEHTPTSVDLYELKGVLLKEAGDIKAAVECLDTGRNLDKQDRYINNQTTMFMLQANMDETALQRMSLFTRHEGNPEQNLYDMQCTWYELELAACLSRKQEWGRSLKKYSAVVKHFDDFHEDQFDFHSYCIRKVTLRAYTAVLKFEDNLWGHDYYGRAAEGIIGVYLTIHDRPSEFTTEEEPDYSSMTAAERKKAKAQARKKKKAAEKAAEKKAEKAQEQKKKGEDDHNGKKKKNAPSVIDEDPNGEALLKLDPLDEARKYVAQLVEFAPKRLSTWILQYDVSVRRKKPLMALQALLKAKAIDPNSSELLTRTVEFSQKYKVFDDLNQIVKQVLDTETPSLLGGRSLNEFVKSATENVKADPMCDIRLRLAVADANIKTKTSPVQDACSLVTEGGLNGRGVTAASCREILAFLKKYSSDGAEASVSQWILQVKERYPKIADFE